MLLRTIGALLLHGFLLTGFFALLLGGLALLGMGHPFWGALCIACCAAWTFLAMRGLGPDHFGI